VNLFKHRGNTECKTIKTIMIQKNKFKKTSSFLLCYFQCSRGDSKYPQVEDARCNIEIDDTSLASAAAISRATDEFVAQNPALIGEIAVLLTDAVGSDAMIGAGKAQKTGVAAPLHVLILDMRLESVRGRSSGSNGSMAALLLELLQERISYTLHSFSTQCSDQPGEPESEQDSASLRMRVVNTLLHSTARLVHFECDLLPSGGDLVLQWVLEEVVLHDDAVRQLVLSSTSHHHLVDSKSLADTSALGQGHSADTHSADTSWPHAHQLSHGSECDTSGEREGKGEEEDFGPLGEEEDFGPWVDHSPHPRCCQIQEGTLIFLFYFAHKTNLKYRIFV
jgi:hypothetical protein